ncbi:MAG: RNase adapter RapZ [Deltaproteobacteria bacterium]|nr:RNase adapter RapZ [Deltaproteobacteria bacterium]
MSGAGKSTALHALEDVGFFCIDNLPVGVLGAALAECEGGGVRRVAVGVDVRVRSFLDRAPSALDSLHVPGVREVEVLFLDASDEALLRRFSSTRRPHPLSVEAGPARSTAFAVLDGVRVERERLAPLRARAKRVVDTTELSVHDLRRRIVESFGPGATGQPRLAARVLSFGFKYGMPVDADVVLDVRFLPNPFFVDRLRAQSGLDEEVRDFVLGQPDARTFLEHTRQLLEFSIPRFEAEGKSYLTIAVGCTGGRHRSVALAEALAAALTGPTGLPIGVVHRDLGREGGGPGGPVHRPPSTSPRPGEGGTE